MRELGFWVPFVLICGKLNAYPMRKLQPEELFILACAKIEPSAEEINRINDLIPQIKNWDYTLKLAIENGMAPLVNNKIPLLDNGSMVPAGVKEKLSQTYLKTLSRNMVLYEHFRQIVTELGKAGIDVIPLKGIYLAEFLYKDIGLRQMSDIDILVRKEDAQKCVTILEGLGYQKGLSLAEMVGLDTNSLQHLTPMVKQGVSVEIHTKLQGGREKFSVNLDDIWNNSIPSVTAGVSIKALDIHHLLIHIATHLEKHFTTERIQLNGFIDTLSIIENFEKEVDWGRIESLCEEYGCPRNFHRILGLAKKYFDCNLPDRYVNIKPYLDDELKLVKLLKNPDVPLHSGIRNFKVIKAQKNIVQSLVYIFPPMSFMVARYGFRNMILIPFYYLYRLWIGVRQVLRAIFKY